MKIELSQVRPLPMVGDPISDSQIWDTDVTIDGRHCNLVTSASGKGKTTLLSFIYGIRTDYNGSVRIDGKSTTDYSEEEWATFRRHTMAYVYQDMRLFSELTGWENLNLKMSLAEGKSKEEVKEMAAQLEVDHLLDKPCGKMSLGQQQRVSIVRALAQPFKLLLMDEPFSHIDEGNIERASKLIQTVCKENEAGFILTSLGYEYLFEYDRKLSI